MKQKVQTVTFTTSMSVPNPTEDPDPAVIITQNEFSLIIDHLMSMFVNDCTEDEIESYLSSLGLSQIQQLAITEFAVMYDFGESDTTDEHYSSEKNFFDYFTSL